MQRTTGSGQRTTGSGLVCIGITGGIACGKSLVGKILSGLDVDIRDADDVGHELMVSGEELFNRIVARFGSAIVDSNGEINRSALGQIVFSDPAKRDELNRLIHPEIFRELKAWINGGDARSLVSTSKEPADGFRPRICAVIVPLLYEVNWLDLWDWVICVAAPRSIQIERLKSRGLSRQEALIRINAQSPVEEKIKRADYVIFNTGTREQVKDQITKVFQDIMEQVNGEHRRK